MNKYIILVILLLLSIILSSCYDGYTGMILSDEQVKNYNLIKNKTYDFTKNKISITETNEYGDILFDNGYYLEKIKNNKYIFKKQKLMKETNMSYEEYLMYVNKNME